MSSSNRVALAYVKESTAGTTPASPFLLGVCHTDPNLAAGIQTAVDESICGGSGREIEDLILLGLEASGGWNFEAKYSLLSSELMAGFMWNTWQVRNRRTNRAGASEISAVGSGAYTVSSGTSFSQDDLVRAQGFANDENNGVFAAGSSSSGTSIKRSGVVSETPGTDARLAYVGEQASSADLSCTVDSDGMASLDSSTLDFTTLSLKVGDWVKIGGEDSSNRFATDANNGMCRISAISATSLDFDITPSGFADDAGTGKTIWLFLGERLTNGITASPFTIEQRFLDHSPVTYEYYRGMFPGTFSISGDAQAKLTGSLSFMGLSVSDPTNTQVSGATNVSALQLPTINTSSNVAALSASGPNFVTSASFEIDNNLRRQSAWDNLGSVGMPPGDFNASGNLTTYFGDKTLLQKLRSNTETGIYFAFEDAEDHGLVIDNPRCKFTDGNPDAGTRNTDVTLPLTYQALYDADKTYTTKLMRFEAV